MNIFLHCMKHLGLRVNFVFAASRWLIAFNTQKSFLSLCHLFAHIEDVIFLIRRIFLVENQYNLKCHGDKSLNIPICFPNCTGRQLTPILVIGICIDETSVHISTIITKNIIPIHSDPNAVCLFLNKTNVSIFI